MLTMQKLPRNGMSELPFPLTSMPVGRLVEHKHGVLYLQDTRGERRALNPGCTVHKAQTHWEGGARAGAASGQVDISNASDLPPWLRVSTAFWKSAAFNTC